MVQPSAPPAPPAEPETRPALIQAPPAGTSDGVPEGLLVLLTGGMLGQGDYDALLGAIKAQTGTGVRLWVAVPHIDWGYMTGRGCQATDKRHAYSDTLVRQAVDAAVAEGFPLQGKPEARMENVWAAMHSAAACFYPASPMKHCAGAVMLAAVVDGMICSVADATAAPRPLMHVLGALDGQLRVTRAGWTAVHLATQAAQIGARRFAASRPFAVVPAMNHGQFSNGVVNTARGDVPSDVPLETQAEAVAGLLVSFIAANHPASSEEVARRAVDSLLQATSASFEMLAPFCEAAGRGSPAALLAAPAPPADHASAAFAYAMGAERLSPFAPDRNAFGHPGELAAAERFARSAQRRMLEAGVPCSVPPELARVRIAVTLDTFIYSQPTAYKDETPAGAEWVVHVHAHPRTDYYDSSAGMAAALKPMSPCFLLKLKKGGAVAAAMGLEGGEGVVTAADLNADTLAAALAAVAPACLEVYRRRGKQLSFGADEDVTSRIQDPRGWMATPLKFEPGSDGGLTLTAPCVSTPVAPGLPLDKGPGRFAGEGWGNHYVHVISPAWAHEWVMIESLRRG